MMKDATGQDKSGIQTEEMMKYHVNVKFTELYSYIVNVSGEYPWSWETHLEYLEGECLKGKHSGCTQLILSLEKTCVCIERENIEGNFPRIQTSGEKDIWAFSMFLLQVLYININIIITYITYNT